MTRCQHIQELLTGHVSGELAPLERAIVDDHLAECAPCRDELAFARDLARAVADTPPVTCPDRVTAAIEAEIDAETGARPARRRPHRAWFATRPARAMGAAAVLAAAVLAVVLLPQRAATPDVEVAGSPAAPAGTELASAKKDFLWTLAYTAAVLDHSEKRSVANVLHELRARTPDSHADALRGDQG
jgi:anti-sigma factor RsiW